MRRLEDGTYMYDTDTRWDRIFPMLFFTLILFSLTILWAVFAYNEFKEEGLKSFYYLTDKGTGYVGQLFAGSVWGFLFLKASLRELNNTRSKDCSND